MSTEREKKYKLSKELTDKYEELKKFTTKKGRLKINKTNDIKKIITDKKDKIKFKKYLDLAKNNKNTPEKQNIKESPKKKLKVKEIKEKIKESPKKKLKVKENKEIVKESPKKKLKNKQLLKNKNLSNNKMGKSYCCKICETETGQKSHHDAHLKSKSHKQACKIFSLELEKHEFDDILEKYPQYKNIKNKIELIKKIVEDMSTVNNGENNGECQKYKSSNEIVWELSENIDVNENYKQVKSSLESIIKQCHNALYSSSIVGQKAQNDIMRL